MKIFVIGLTVFAWGAFFIAATHPWAWGALGRLF
jgi:hypothetical protein